MSVLKRLSDTEFEVMKVAWTNESPITTNIVMQQLGNRRQWKAQTVISLMLRLVKKGYLRTEKNGKERTYFPLIEKEAYLEVETGSFLKLYHEDSFVSLVTALYSGKHLSDEDIKELLTWVKERKE